MKPDVIALLGDPETGDPHSLAFREPRREGTRPRDVASIVNALNKMSSRGAKRRGDLKNTPEIAALPSVARNDT